MAGEYFKYTVCRQEVTCLEITRTQIRATSSIHVKTYLASSITGKSTVRAQAEQLKMKKKRHKIYFRFTAIIQMKHF